MDTLQSTKCLLCDRIIIAKGLCRSHYQQYWNSKLPLEEWIKGYQRYRKCRKCGKEFEYARYNRVNCKDCLIKNRIYIGTYIDREMHEKLKKINISHLILRLLKEYLS